MTQAAQAGGGGPWGAGAGETVVLAERRGSVLLLTLNRPERLNAWVPAMEVAYFAALAEADADPSVRAVVVTGAGPGFCAGADLGALSGIDLSAGLSVPERRWDAFPPTMRTPVVAAVNGACAGVGLVVALQCDVRFVSATARLATSFARRGLIAEHGSSWLLPRLVGRGRALDLLMTGRTFTGEEAGRFGLAEFVLPAEEVLAGALAYATDLAENVSPTAVAVIKAQVQRHADADPVTALAESDELMLRAFARPDVVEGLAAWQEKRPPRFPPVDAAAAELDPQTPDPRTPDPRPPDHRQPEQRAEGEPVTDPTEGTPPQTPGFRDAFPGLGQPATVLDGADGLRGAVGRHLGHGDWHEITQEQVDAFAAATWDHQWIHVDPERAAAGPFGGTIAHGFLTLSLASFLAAEVVEVRGVRMGVNYGSDRVRFPSPVRVGSRIRGGGELVDVTEVTGGLQATFRLTVEVEGSSKPACVADLLSRYYF